MPLQIHPASPLDAPALTAVLLAAFNDDFNHALFPRTVDVREWWTAKFAYEMSQPGQVLLKVVDASSASCASDDGEIVGFALWKLPSTTTDLSACINKEDKEEEESWPASSDASLCSHFFGQMAKKRKMYMGSRPHYCTFIHHNTLKSIHAMNIHAKQNRPRHTSNSPNTSRPRDSLAVVEMGS